VALLTVQKVLVPQSMGFLLLVCYCFYFSKIESVDEGNKKYKIAKYLNLKIGSCRNSETSVWIIQLCCLLLVWQYVAN